MVSFTNLHHASLTNFPFANLGVHWRVWGVLDGISRPLTNFAKIDFGAYIYINEFGVDRWTLGSIDKFCHLQKKNIPVFLGGARGTLTNFRTRKKGAIQWRHKSTFVTWPRHWANSHEQKGRKEWTVWGEFTRRLKNLRWRNWGLKDEQWFQQFFEKLLRPIERSKLFMNHVLKSRFVPWSSASLRMNPWVATWGGKKCTRSPILLYSVYLLAKKEKNFSMVI